MGAAARFELTRQSISKSLIRYDNVPIRRLRGHLVRPRF